MNTDELLNNSSNNNSEQQQSSSSTETAVPVVVKKKLSQKQKKELRKQRQQPHKPRPANLETFNTFRKRNNLLEKYYSELQKVLKDEEELNEFIHSFQQPLPIAFRINHTLQFPEKIIKKIKAFAESIKDVRVDKASTKEYLNPTPITASNDSEDNNIATSVEQQEQVNSTTVVEAKEEEECTPEYASLHPVSYIPNEMVWQMNDNVSKTLLRKHPAFAEFRDFLMKETERGNISRQEIVSMLPPMMFTNWKSTDRVLDMCAAPGSKTSQLIELLYKASGRDLTKMEGFVVANDNDVKRAYLLVHQLQRLSFLFPHLVITNHDATKFPQFKDPNNEKLLFDKILCDVPCCGDGTVRKSPDIWKRWKGNMGHGLHQLQVDCVLKAFDLLKVGGELVYSTCTLNPIEDEAVLAEVLRRTKGKLVLQEIGPRFPHLKYSPGMTSWVVTNKKCDVIPSFAECKGKNYDQRIVESEFPRDDVKDMNLHYAMRILPQQNNTGGFFIALLKKVGDLDEPVGKQSDEGEEVIVSVKGRTTSYDLIQSVDPEKLDEIFDFYHINKNSFNKDQFCLRISEVNSLPTEGIRKIMFISPSVRKFLEQNEKEGNKYNVVNCGIRVFERANAAFLRCPFRITQEAAHILWNHMDDTRKVVLNENNFKYFLIEPHTPVEVLRKNGQSDVADKIEKAEPGGVLVKLEEEDGCDEILAVGLKGALTLARHIKLEIAQAVLKSLGSEEEIKKYTKSYLEKRQQGSGDKVLDEMLLNEEEL